MGIPNREQQLSEDATPKDQDSDARVKDVEAGRDISSSDSIDDWSKEKETQGHGRHVNSSTGPDAGLDNVEPLEKQQTHKSHKSHRSMTSEPLEQQQTNKSHKSHRSIRSHVPSVNDVSTVPNGGLQAWLQVLGSFFLFFNSWGILNTFGAYTVTYQTDILKSSSSSAISWIGSLQAFCLVFFGPLTGPIYDAGYFRALIMTGSFLVVFGHMMLSLSHEYWQIFLSQAVCIGLGASCLFVPSVAILSTYFNTRLATATGIAATGSSLGGVIYPIILYRILPVVGFAWATRILGFMALATLLISNAVMKVRVLPAQRRKILDLPAFKELPYLLFVMGSVLGFAGLYAPFFYTEYYSLTYNIAGPVLSFYTLAIINAGSVFGRVIPNLVADRIGPMNVIAPACVLSGVICFCYIPAKTTGPLFTVSALYGFFSGALVSLPSTVYVSLSTHKRGMIGTRMGMGLFVSSIGILLGAPSCGWILDASNYTFVWVFGGLLLAIGGSIMAAARIAKTRSISLRIKA